MTPTLRRPPIDAARSGTSTRGAARQASPPSCGAGAPACLPGPRLQVRARTCIWFPARAGELWAAGRVGPRRRGSQVSSGRSAGSPGRASGSPGGGRCGLGAPQSPHRAAASSTTRARDPRALATPRTAGGSWSRRANRCARQQVPAAGAPAAATATRPACKPAGRTCTRGQTRDRPSLAPTRNPRQVHAPIRWDTFRSHAVLGAVHHLGGLGWGRWWGSPRGRGRRGCRRSPQHVKIGLGGLAALLADLNDPQRACLHREQQRPCLSLHREDALRASAGADAHLYRGTQALPRACNP
jgi:hypothetical protein